MSSKERFLYLIIILLGGIYIYYSLFSNDEEYVDGYNIKIENLEQKVNRLHDLNGQLTLKIDTLNTQILQLDQELHLTDKKINNLKYETDIKVKSVDTFNSNELERFFTNRYRHYLDSIKEKRSPPSN